MPLNAVCCVFQYNSSEKNMQHTGLHIGGGQIIHCSGKVKQGSTKDKTWTHYAIPKGMQEKVALILVMSRQAKLYLLDEPIAGVDPAARDYILHTIISNYDREASILISTHLIADVEEVLDDVIFINKGKIILSDTTENIKTREEKTVDGLFREMFRC